MKFTINNSTTRINELQKNRSKNTCFFSSGPKKNYGEINFPNNLDNSRPLKIIHKFKLRCCTNSKRNHKKPVLNYEDLKLLKNTEIDLFYARSTDRTKIK